LKAFGEFSCRWVGIAHVYVPLWDADVLEPAAVCRAGVLCGLGQTPALGWALVPTRATANKEPKELSADDDG